MFSLNTKSTGLLFCLATTLLLLEPLSANAQATERSGVRNAKSLGSSIIKSDAKKLAQFEPEEVEVDVVEPVNREANPSSSYLGIGGNIGFGGDDTAIGDGAFAVLGKGALSSHFALHPAVLFGDKNTILLPVTYGISIENDSSEILYPFVGGGISIKEIFDDFDLGGLVTAGVDVPVSDRLTGTARFNVGFGDDTDTGLILGIGYGT